MFVLLPSRIVRASPIEFIGVKRPGASNRIRRRSCEEVAAAIAVQSKWIANQESPPENPRPGSSNGTQHFAISGVAIYIASEQGFPIGIPPCAFQETFSNELRLSCFLAAFAAAPAVLHAATIGPYPFLQTSAEFEASEPMGGGGGGGGAG